MVQSILTNKRGQGWGLDLMAAITIFLAGVIILYVYAFNYTSGAENSLDELYYEGNLVSELILTENAFGIFSEGKINQTKLNNFNATYNAKKSMYGVKNDFYFFMENMEINGIDTKYVGKINETQTTNLMKITRLVVYKNRPTKLELYIYTE